MYLTFVRIIHYIGEEVFHAIEMCLIYLLTAFGLAPDGNSTVNIYTKRMHRTTQCNRIYIRTEHTLRRPIFYETTGVHFSCLTFS